MINYYQNSNSNWCYGLEPNFKGRNVSVVRLAQGHLCSLVKVLLKQAKKAGFAILGRTVVFEPVQPLIRKANNTSFI